MVYSNFDVTYLAGFRGDNSLDDLLRYIGDKPASGAVNNQPKVTKNNTTPVSKKQPPNTPTPTPTTAECPPARHSSPAKEASTSKDGANAKKPRKKKHSQHNAPNVADVTGEKEDAIVTSVETNKTPNDAKKNLFSDDVSAKQQQRQTESKRGSNEANVTKPAVTTAPTNNTKKSTTKPPQQQQHVDNHDVTKTNNNNHVTSTNKKSQTQKNNNKNTSKKSANHVTDPSSERDYIFTDFEPVRQKSVEREFQTVASKKKKRHAPSAHDAYDMPSLPRSVRAPAREAPAAVYDVTTPRGVSRKSPVVTPRSKTPPPSSPHKHAPSAFVASNMTSSASSSSSFDSGVERTPSSTTSGVSASLFPHIALDAGAFPALGSSSRSGRRYSTGNAEFENESASKDAGSASARGGESDAESCASFPVDSSDSRAGASGASTAASCSSAGSSQAASLNVRPSYAKAVRAPQPAPALAPSVKVQASDSSDDLVVSSQFEPPAPCTDDRRHSLGSADVI